MTIVNLTCRLFCPSCGHEAEFDEQHFLEAWRNIDWLRCHRCGGSSVANRWLRPAEKGGS